jgi:hypothetical protein
MAVLPHNKILQAATRQALKPLGVVQNGRSRKWIDDNGWWLGIVYFQPSSGQSSRLELGVGWLWDRRQAGSLGHSVSSTIRSEGWSIYYESEEQFTPLARQQATLAASLVCNLRLLLQDPTTAAAQTGRDGVWIGPRRKLDPLAAAAVAYFEKAFEGRPPSDAEIVHAVLLALIGKMSEAAAIFDRRIELTDFSVPKDWQPSQGWFDGRQREYDRICQLRRLADDHQDFVAEIRRNVVESRIDLGLDHDVELPF